MESRHSSDTTPAFSHFFDYAHLTDEQRAFVTDAGNFWRAARELDGVARAEIAERMKIDPSLKTLLALFENGLLQPDAYSGDFLQRYAEALGKPELLDEFREKFGLVQDSTPA